MIAIELNTRIDPRADSSDPVCMSSMPVMPLDDRPPLTLSGGDLPSKLDDSDYAQLVECVRLARPARKAAGYAGFSGWATLLAGAMSLPFSIGDLPMMIFCVVIAGIGTRELSLRRRLMRLETSTPRKLAVNQLVLGGCLIAYAIFKLAQPAGESVLASSIGSDPSLQSMPEIANQLDGIAQLERVLIAGIYAIMMLVAFFVQGGTAIYYICKTRALRRLHQRSPEWCIRVYRTIHA